MSGHQITSNARDGRLSQLTCNRLLLLLKHFLIIDFKHFSQENVSFGDERSDWKRGGDFGNPVKMPLWNFAHSWSVLWLKAQLIDVSGRMRHRTTNSHLVSLSFGSRLCESEVSGYYANELCARLKLALAHLHKRIKWFKARHDRLFRFTSSKFDIFSCFGLWIVVKS